MILVIADDLTGAAEVAGIAHRYGFAVEILRAANGFPASCAEVKVYDTNSRELSAQHASRIIRSLANDLQEYPVSHVFKKIDSVCRGNIASEIETLMDIMKCPRALVVPASPTTNRIVDNGKLYVDGQLIEDTVFCGDPSHPALTSEITRILQPQAQRHVISIQALRDVNEYAGLIVPDCCTIEDMYDLAAQSDKNMLMAGSAAFFETWLMATSGTPRRSISRPIADKLRKPLLLISGSMHTNSAKQLLNFEKSGGKTVIVDHSACDDLVSDIGRHTEENNDLALSTNANIINRMSHDLLCDISVKTIIDWNIQAVIVSGGNTAERIADALGWRRLKPESEIEQGFVVMTAPDSIQFIAKPGSYGGEHIYSCLLSEN